jgi:amino acid transporter
MSESTAAVSPDLQRASLRAPDIVFFVVAAAAPLTVMAAVAPIAILIGGIGAPAGYLAAGVISAVFAAGFMRMAKFIHNNGAFYSYIQRGLGRVAGLASALVAVVSYNALQFSVYGLFGAVTTATAADVLGVVLPWWCWALIGVVVVGALGYRSVHVGARVLGVLLVLEVLVLAVLAVAVLAQGGAQGLTLEPFAASNIFTGSMGAVLAVAFAAFVGFEATALYRNEAHDPDRTVPRATYIAVGFLSIFYCFIVWVVIMAFGTANIVEVAGANPAEVFFTAMDTYVGGWATTVMRLLIVTSGLAALLAIHNAVTRYGYALGRESVIPARLAAVHPRHRSPHVASIVQSVLAAVVIAAFALANTDPVLQMAAWSASAGTIGIIALQSLTSFSVASFFGRGDGPRSGSAVAIGLLGGVLLAGAVVLIIRYIDLATLTADFTTNAVIVAIPLVLFAAGTGYGVWLRRSRPSVYAGLGSTDVDAEL